MERKSPDQIEERPFSQEELKRAYAQIVAERNGERREADGAARVLRGFVEKTVQVESSAPWGGGFYQEQYAPNPASFCLLLYLCDYDNWKAVIEKLKKAGVNMQLWDETYRNMPRGTWVAPNGRTYEVRIQYYNSHDGECTT